MSENLDELLDLMISSTPISNNAETSNYDMDDFDLDGLERELGLDSVTSPENPPNNDVNNQIVSEIPENTENDISIPLTISVISGENILSEGGNSVLQVDELQGLSDETIDKITPIVEKDVMTNNSSQEDVHIKPSISQMAPLYIESSGGTVELAQKEETSSAPTNAPELPSWLDSSNPIVTKSVTINSVDNELSLPDFISESTPVTAPTPVNPTVKVAMDTFFDEVFGSDISSVPPLRPAVSSLERELTDIIRSSFPDIEQLRKLILTAGFVPSSLRGQIWSMLLNGSCTEDQEAEFWRCNGTELKNFDALVEDCDAIVDRCVEIGSLTTPPDPEQARNDMKDLLVLYCVRRGTPYHPFLCYLIAPLVSVPLPLPRPLASSCFYSLCSGFIPLINLRPGILAPTIRTVHSWLRRLLAYHFPALLLHLDRVLFPGWEQPTRSISPSQAKRQLEADTSSILDIHADSPASSDAPIESNRNKKRHIGADGVSEGVIPQHWIIGLFSGSLPPSECILLWDWALLHNERYAGLYLSTALIGGFESVLLTYNGQQIEDWFSRLGRSDTDWYRALHGHQSKKCPHDSWQSFVSGWLLATTYLKKETPLALAGALADTESWAQTKLHSRKSQAHPISIRPLKPRGEEGEWEFFGQYTNPGQAIMSGFRNLSKLVGGTPSDTGSEVLDESSHGMDTNPIQRFPHETQAAGVSLWSNVEEVIPCLCGTRRRSQSQPNYQNWTETVFRSAWGFDKEESEQGRIGSRYLPPPSPYSLQSPNSSNRNESEDGPYYFAVDCRSQFERRLGRFPKAYVFDPKALTDPDALSSLLEALQPLAGSMHICLMGAGEDYVRMNLRLVHGEGGREGALEEALNEQITRLNAIAIFFIKQNFSRISVLDGGFATAARLLNSDKSITTLSTALVDAHGPSLDALLGTVDALRQGRHSTPAAPVNELNPLAKVDAVFSSVVSTIGGQLAAMREGKLGDQDPSQGDWTDTDGDERDRDRDQGGSGGISLVSGLVANLSVERREQVAEGAKEVLGDISKRFNSLRTVTMASIKKKLNTSQDEETSASGGNAGRDRHSSMQDAFGGITKLREIVRGKDDRGRSQSENPVTVGPTLAASGARATGPTFTIDSEEDEEGSERGINNSDHQKAQQLLAKGEERPSRDIPDTTSISITRTEAEKAQALAIHHLSGLRTGDMIPITRECLPGAVLFPAIRCDDEEDAFYQDNPLHQKSSPDVESSDVPESSETSMQSSLLDPSSEETKKKISVQLHRFLVVTRERFIVLDSNGGGVGSNGVVCSNHHLTELLKMTFRKKEPDVVTLFFASPGTEPRTKVFRVSKKSEFIECLQKHMRRFK